MLRLVDVVQHSSGETKRQNKKLYRANCESVTLCILVIYIVTKYITSCVTHHSCLPSLLNKSS